MKKAVPRAVAIGACCLAVLARGGAALANGGADSTAYRAYRGDIAVSSYIRTWPLGPTATDRTGRSHWRAADIRGEYLTDLIIAFARVRAENGTIFFPDADGGAQAFTDLWKETEKLQGKFPNLRIHVSLGGWGADGFSQVSADPVKRATLVAEITALTEKRKLAGIDIDWEYPVGPDEGQEIASSPADAENFLLLLSAIRAAFAELDRRTGTYHTLSVAVPAIPWYPQKIDVKAVAALVDSVKLMSYDYYGPWSATTGHLANLRNNPADPAWGGWSTEQALRLYREAGVPPRKIILGIGFYGLSWRGVPDGGTHGLYQRPAEQAGTEWYSWPELKAFLGFGSRYRRYWDETAQSPFLYDGDAFITYTDPQAIRAICAFAKSEGLAGVMMWEYGHDLNGELLREVSRALR